VTQTSQSSWASDMCSTFGIITFQTTQVWNSWNYLLAPTSKSQLHNDILVHTVVEKNICPSNVTVTDILGSYHLPIMFIITDSVRTREAPDKAGKLTDWELLQTSSLNPYLQMSKFTFLMRVIKQHVISQPTDLRHTDYRRENL
jgi:hypothetical protein